MPNPSTLSLSERLNRVKLLLLDVDGVLTDATVTIGAAAETKQFNINDGLGLVLCRQQGIKVGWVSSRPSTATEARARELKIDFLRQEKGSKVAVIEAILTETGQTWENVCYAGDDIVDLGALRRAGLAVAVANAVPEAKDLAHYVTQASGGRGAVREIVEMILKAQGRWDSILKTYES